MQKLEGFKVVYPLSSILPQKPPSHSLGKLLNPRTTRILYDVFHLHPHLIRDGADTTLEIVELLKAWGDDRKSHLFFRIKAA
jgi:hypothetical protein